MLQAAAEVAAVSRVAVEEVVALPRAAEEAVPQAVEEAVVVPNKAAVVGAALAGAITAVRRIGVGNTGQGQGNPPGGRGGGGPNAAALRRWIWWRWRWRRAGRWRRRRSRWWWTRWWRSRWWRSRWWWRSRRWHVIGSLQSVAGRASRCLSCLLALALSVVVLSAIGMGINLFFKMLDARRTSIEEIQVVQNVTKLMTSDIRGMINPYKPDLSGLDTVFKLNVRCECPDAGCSGSDGHDDRNRKHNGRKRRHAGHCWHAGPGRRGTSRTRRRRSQYRNCRYARTSRSTRQCRTSSRGGAGRRCSSRRCGCERRCRYIRYRRDFDDFDNGRSGREARWQRGRVANRRQSPTARDQYKGMLTSKGEMSTTDLPSDVKTICYFLRSETSAASYAGNPQAPGGEPSTDMYGRGLMRAELDRAVASYAETSGGTASVYDPAFG